MPSTRPRATSLGAAALAALWPAVGSPQPQATAEALFIEGRRDITEGRLQEGCDKLAESQRVDPAGGTALALGLCLEQLGRTASAWASFRDALGAAEHEHNEERLAVARRHLAALEARLTRVKIEVADEQLAGLRVLRDGNELARGSWGVAAPVDPGEHRVEARAPGYQAMTVRFRAAEGDGVRVVALGPLTPARRASPPARTAAWAGLAVGGTALLFGAFQGLRALSLTSQARGLCPGPGPCSSREAEVLSARARDSADLSTVTLIAGAALSLGSGYLLWVTPSPSGGASVAAQGTF